MKRLASLVLLALFFVLASCAPVDMPDPEQAVGTTAALSIPPVSLAPIVTDGLNQPLYLTHAGDGRLFVVEKDGRIRLVQDGRLLAEPFLDIRERVNGRASERGLLGLAFHPDYAQNGRFFVYYTNLAGDTAVSAFQVSSDPNRADPASEQLLLTVAQPFPNHNGGQLAFGPDGYLYVGLGDGGSGGDPQGHGQNPATLLGALLRLDVDQPANGLPYGIPPDNPYAGNGRGQPEVWATGLRNPWRFSFDRTTGDLIIGDVGQNQWEEVSFLAAGSPGGANFGWNVMEGTHCYDNATCDQTGLIPPVAEYRHERGRCSITGGYVYRGSRFPALAGSYFFGDYCSGEIWGAAMESDGRWTTNIVLSTNHRIVSFGEDAQGELYVVDLEGGVYRVEE